MLETGLVAASKWHRSRAREELLLNRNVSKQDARENGVSESALTTICKLCRHSVSLRQHLNERELVLKSATARALKNNETTYTAQLCYQRGTFLELLDKHNTALSLYTYAMSLLTQTTEQTIDDMRNTIQSSIDRLEKQRCMRLEAKRLTNVNPSDRVAAHRVIDRIPFGSITYSQFFTRYASQGIPVIFTGAAQFMIPALHNDEVFPTDEEVSCDQAQACSVSKRLATSSSSSSPPLPLPLPPSSSSSSSDEEGSCNVSKRQKHGHNKATQQQTQQQKPFDWSWEAIRSALGNVRAFHVL